MLKVFLLRAPRHRWVFYADLASFIPPPPAVSSTPHTHVGMSMGKRKRLHKQKALTANQASAMNKVKEAKKSIDEAPPGIGLKGRIRQILQQLEMRIHPTEAILHNIQKATTIEVVSPQLLPHVAEEDIRVLERRNRRVMTVLMRECAAFHKKWSILNALLLPVSALASLLPGPNVFLAWNLYRLYCHIQAYRGAQLFMKKQASNGVLFNVVQGITPHHHHHRSGASSKLNHEHDTSISNSENSSNIDAHKTHSNVDGSSNSSDNNSNNNNNNNNNNNDEVTNMAIQFNLPGFAEYVKKCQHHHKKRR